MAELIELQRHQSESASVEVATLQHNRFVVEGALVLMALAVWLASSARPFMWGASSSVLGMLYLRRMMKQRLGGYTGDGLGAVQQVSEALFYLGILIALSADNVEVTVDPTS